MEEGPFKEKVCMGLLKVINKIKQKRVRTPEC